MKLFLLLIFIGSNNIIYAQTSKLDYNNLNHFFFNIKHKEIKGNLNKKHSIKKAIILSSIVPGSGQIYNHLAMPKGKKKGFWKVPLIYSGIGISSYFLITNQTTQKSLKNEYIARQNGESGNVEWADLQNNDQVLTLYNQYLSWRDLSIVAVSLVYILQLTDAGVEAHFVNFDISKDLSISINPTILNYQNAGIQLSINFN